MTDILVVIYYLLRVYFYTMILYVILSWTPLVNSPFYKTLSVIVNPYLGIFRGWLVISGIDFTPMLGLIIFQLLVSLLGSALAQAGFIMLGIS